MKSSNSALFALTAASISLPGMVPKSAHAEAAPEYFTGGYRFTRYQEADQPSSVPNGEALPRYDIAVHQFSVKGPIAPDVVLNVSAITETLSGASPWYVAPDADGKPLLVMSGATIEESRNELNASTGFYRDRSVTSVGLSYSGENDYQSLGANVSNTLWFNDNNTTMDVGFSFSVDTVSPTQDSRYPTRTKNDEDKVSGAFFAGVSQVLSSTLLVGVNVSYKLYSGFLSDPYKLAFVDGQVLQDSRPDERQQGALDLQLRKYFPSISTALHADYRRYDDNWRVGSNTFTFGTYTNVDTWQFVTKLRLYQQDQAAFYRLFYVAPRADELYSSDYRLSAYEAVSIKFGVNKKFDFGTLYASYEQYDSGNGTNPGLVDFGFVTIGMDYKF